MTYALPNADEAAELRLRALGELFDASTFRHLDALGLPPTARCWEIGAGGPSVPRQLAARFAHVLATDLDISRIGHVPGVDVRVHDVAKDAIPERAYDLIHARLVLVHVRERDTVLARLADALVPGGWLVVEDADPALQPLAAIDDAGGGEPARLANRLKLAFRSLLVEGGAELAFGRSLPRRLRAVGLGEVACDAYFPIAMPACVDLERATLAQVGPRLVARQLASEAQIAEHLANVETGRVDIVTSPMITAWGRAHAF